jgi:hypothetical protein
MVSKETMERGLRVLNGAGRVTQNFMKSAHTKNALRLGLRGVVTSGRLARKFMRLNKKGKAAVIVAGAVAWATPYAAIAYGTVRTDTCTVTDKTIKRYGDTDKYLVFTEQCDVMENTDTRWWMKYNSSTVQGKLRVGETYDIKSNGWRVPYFSWYRNVLRVDKIEPPAMR